MRTRDEVRSDIRNLVHEYMSIVPPVSSSRAKYLPYSKMTYGTEEVEELVEASLEFWLTHGHYSREFEENLAKYFGVAGSIMVNSGSSANLIAFATLMSPKLGDRRIKKGDEVITVAACFPTTVAPIIQNGCVPVFVDVSIPTYNIDIDRMREALSPLTKAVVLAHTLGNPFDIHRVKAFCEDHGLWLIEDNCDALGSTYAGKLTGTFGDLATSSFYPPHHITTGEGGAVYTNNMELLEIATSLRDWGRDCWCRSGHDNSCGKRFTGEHGSLPKGYDHKYVYGHLGYNLKATDLQAAIGCIQLSRIEGFVDARRRNWAILRSELESVKNHLVLPEPTRLSDPSWFGFMMIAKDMDRTVITRSLEAEGIQTRTLFAGNITRHPCFSNLVEGRDYYTHGTLINSDIITEQGFWIGVAPNLSSSDVAYMAEVLVDIVSGTHATC